jgi:hypothetical protein
MINNDMTGLKNTVDSFIGDYANRGEVEFSAWLADRLRQEMPDMSESDSQKLCGDIIAGISEYDNTLKDLNSAIEAGQSKEGWFADCVKEAAADIPINEAGNALVAIESSLHQANTELLQDCNAIPHIIEAEYTETEDTETDWNEYSYGQKLLDVGGQAVAAGLCVAANVIVKNIESDEPLISDDTSGVIGEALKAGLETAQCEVKAVVAGAVKSVAEEGLTDFLPPDTPVETICDLAGAAVEGACALYDAAMGKRSDVEALDIVARANAAAACRGAVKAAKNFVALKVAFIPVVGMPLAIIANCLFMKLESPKFVQEAAAVVSNIAVTAYNKGKSAVRKSFNWVKRKIFG